MTEAPSKAYSKVVVPVLGYSCLHQHSSRVSIGLRNLTCKPVTIKAKTAVATIPVANVIPSMLAPKLVAKSSTVEATDSTEVKENLSKESSSFLRAHPKLPPEKLEELYFKLNFSGIVDWSEKE